MGTYILTMVILVGSGGALTTVQAEYTTKMKCEVAKDSHREKLTTARVILANCTAK
jgi:hypothetical protein